MRPEHDGGPSEKGEPCACETACPRAAKCITSEELEEIELDRLEAEAIEATLVDIEEAGQ